MTIAHRFTLAAVLFTLAACTPGLVGTAVAQGLKPLPKKPLKQAPLVPPAQPAGGANAVGGFQGQAIPLPGNPFNGMNGAHYNNFGGPWSGPANYYNGYNNPALSPFSPLAQYQMGLLADYYYLNGPPAVFSNPYWGYPPVVSQYGYYGNPWGPYPPWTPSSMNYGYQFGPWMQNNNTLPWNQPGNLFPQPMPLKGNPGGLDPANILK